MGEMVLTIQAMPVSPDVNYEELMKKIEVKIREVFNTPVQKKIMEPVAFGINAMKFFIVVDESIEDIDGKLEKISNELDEVESLEVVDMRRVSF